MFIRIHVQIQIYTVSHLSLDVYTHKSIYIIRTYIQTYIHTSRAREKDRERERDRKTKKGEGERESVRERDREGEGESLREGGSEGERCSGRVYS